MLAVYIALLMCTMLPVVALQVGIGGTFMVWLVFGLVIVKAVLLVDHFMEMRHAPSAWRVAAQAWTAVIVMVLAGLHLVTL